MRATRAAMHPSRRTAPLILLLLITPPGPHHTFAAALNQPTHLLSGLNILPHAAPTYLHHAGHAQRYAEAEAEVFNALLTLIRDTAVLREYAAAALAIIQAGWGVSVQWVCNLLSVTHTRGHDAVLLGISVSGIAAPALTYGHGCVCLRLCGFLRCELSQPLPC